MLFKRDNSNVYFCMKYCTCLFSVLFFLLFLVLSTFEQSYATYDNETKYEHNDIHNSISINDSSNSCDDSSNKNTNVKDKQGVVNSKEFKPAIEGFREGIYTIASSASWSRVVDVPSASLSSGKQLNIYNFNNSEAQKFQFILNSDGTYTIKNLNSSLVLDVSGASTAPGTSVVQYTHNDSKAQKWQIINKDDNYQIKSVLGNLFLDVQGAKDQNSTLLNVYSGNDSDAQAWMLTPDGQDIKFANTPLDSSEYIFSCNAATDKAADIQCGSIYSGANLQIYEGNKTNAQTFIFTFDSNGYYTITNKNSKLALDVQGASINNNTNVWQYSKNNSLAQKWVITKNNDGTYCLHSALKKNYVLDVYGGKSDNGTNINMYENNLSAAQKWSFYDPKYNPIPGKKLFSDGYYNLADVQTGLVIDIPAKTHQPNTQPQAYTKNNTLAQAFYLQWTGSDDSGFYKIFSACGDNLALAVSNSSVLPGSKVLTKNTDGDEALWSVINNSNTFSFVNKASGLCLSFAASPAQPQTKVVGTSSEKATNWALNEAVLFTEGIYQFESYCDNNLVIDNTGASRQTYNKLQLYSSNGSMAQKWKVKKDTSNNFAFQCLNSGKWMGVDESNNVVQKDRSSSSSFDSDLLWYIGVEHGYYTLTHVATGKRLDCMEQKCEECSNIIVNEKSSSYTQCWDLTPKNLLDDRVYNISIAYNYRKIDVNSGSFSNGAKIQMYDSNSSAPQAFRVYNNSDGTVSFKNVKSRKYLDVPGGSVGQNVNICQYSGNGSLAQKWVPEFNDSGYLIIRSALNQKYALDGGLADNCTPVHLYEYNSNLFQKFEFNIDDNTEVDIASGCSYIDQNPELPWGCESVALTQLLTGMGYYYGKTHIADNYIPYSDWDYVNCYAGNPYVPYGIGCTMPPCICNAANGFLQNNGSRFRASVATGTSLWDLIERANAGYPSVVWTTMYMRSVVKHSDPLWGYQLYWGEHAVCLCGYDAASDSVLVCDSLAGKIWRNRAEFESIYDQIGRYCVVVD